MESMKQKFFRAAVPLVMLAVSAALSVFVYRLPQPVREPLPVLMYHHMVPDGQDCNDMTVTPGKVRADWEPVLAMGYTPVLPRELLQEFSWKKLKKTDILLDINLYLGKFPLHH